MAEEMVGNPSERRELKPAGLLRIAIVLYLVFPFLFLIWQFHPDQLPDGAELLWAFKNSFWQAFFSALGSLFFGWWTALGLIFLSVRRPRLRPVVEILCLLPNFFPPLFILLATLNILDPFPMGIEGIAIIHILINFGLVAVLVAHLTEAKMGSLTEAAYTLGIGQFHYLRRVFFPILKKDLFLIFLFVFVMCFGSFSVPLIVGGSRGTTIELLIYEKIRLSSHWGEAVFLALLQSFFIFGISLWAGRGKSPVSNQPANLRLIAMPTGILLILFSTGLLGMGYWQGLVEGVKAVRNFYEIQSAIAIGFFGSLALGLSVGALTFALLMGVAYATPQAHFEKFMKGYVAPSTALACFCLLILGPNEGFWPFVKIPLAFVMITLNGLYRMGWESHLQSLEKQREAAWILGASPVLVFREITFPQSLRLAGLLSGLAAVWATGDFAVSRILAHRDLSLALMTETLMSSYRLNLATLLSLLVLLAGLICFVFFFWGSRVLSRKS